MSVAFEEDAVDLSQRDGEASPRHADGGNAASPLPAGNGRPLIVNLGYWGEGAVTVREAQRTFVRQLADRLPDLAGQRVLDASRKGGGPAAVLALEYGAHVDAINIPPDQAGVAGAYAATHGIEDRLRFHAGEPTALPFDDASFDVVFSLEAAHGFLDKRRFIREAYRVLVPGGMMALSDLTATLDMPVARWLPSRGVDLVTADAWRGMAEEAGFEIVEHRLVGSSVYPGYRRWLMLSSAERRRAVLESLSPARDAPRAAIRHARAWWLEFLSHRSTYAVIGPLRLREYVLMLARRPGL